MIDELIGRSPDDDESARATCGLVASITIPYDGGAVGVFRGSLHRSTDCEDRGGIFLRLIIEDGGQSFLPTTKKIPGGIEIHMAGEQESEEFLKGIDALISAGRRNS